MFPLHKDESSVGYVLGNSWYAVIDVLLGLYLPKVWHIIELVFEECFDTIPHVKIKAAAERWVPVNYIVGCPLM